MDYFNSMIITIIALKFFSFTLKILLVLLFSLCIFIFKINIYRESEYHPERSHYT
jgi:hypothetical protein